MIARGTDSPPDPAASNRFRPGPPVPARVMVGCADGCRDLLVPPAMTSRRSPPERDAPVPGQLTLRRLDAETFIARLPELISVYVAAMQYPGGRPCGRGGAGR